MPDDREMSRKARENWIYRSYSHAPRGFAAGFWDGVAACIRSLEGPEAGMFMRDYQSPGLRGDWAMIGKDIGNALRRSNEPA